MVGCLARRPLRRGAGQPWPAPLTGTGPTPGGNLARSRPRPSSYERDVPPLQTLVLCGPPPPSRREGQAARQRSRREHGGGEPRRMHCVRPLSGSPTPCSEARPPWHRSATGKRAEAVTTTSIIRSRLGGAALPAGLPPFNGRSYLITS